MLSFFPPFPFFKLAFGHLSKFLHFQGNPCAAFTDYRNFVITVLPQLKTLDGVNIEISERILAKQNFQEISKSIWNQEQQYLLDRKKQLDEVYRNYIDSTKESKLSHCSASSSSTEQQNCHM